MKNDGVYVYQSHQANLKYSKAETDWKCSKYKQIKIVFFYENNKAISYNFDKTYL